MFDFTQVHEHTASLSEVYGHPLGHCRFLPSCTLKLSRKAIIHGQSYDNR